MLFSPLGMRVHVLTNSLTDMPFPFHFSSLRSPHVFSLAMHEIFHPTSFISISIAISELALTFSQTLNIVTNILRVIREPDLMALPMNLIVEVFTLIHWIRYLANTSGSPIQVPQIGEPAFEQALSLLEHYHTLSVRRKCLSSHRIYAFIYFTKVKVILLVYYTSLFPYIPWVYNWSVGPGSENELRHLCSDLHRIRYQLVGFFQEVIKSLLVKDFGIVLNFLVLFWKNSLE